MLFTHAVAALSAASMVAAAPHPVPFKFPLDNGFPNPSTEAIAKIEMHAGGGLPAGALPTKLSDGTITAFQLIGINEIFEVAFFTSLLKNITNGVDGFETDDQDYHMQVFRRIRAQEELHALGVNGLLAGVDAKTVGEGCEFQFGTTNYADAVALANTFTDIVLSLIPVLQTSFAMNGGQEPGLIPLTGSIISQESEQVGWFRSEQHKVPSAAPFLTGNGQASFAASALTNLFIVPNTCKFLPDVPVFPPLTIVTPPTKAKNQMVTYSVEGKVSTGMNSIALINGVNAPYVEPITNVKTKGGVTTFEARLPFEANGGFAKGLTYAILVKGTGKLADGAAVAEAMAYGPGLIEIQ